MTTIPAQIQPALTASVSHDSTSVPAGRRKSALWTGRALSGLAVAFLTFDTLLKVLQLGPAVSGTADLGYSAGSVLVIGLIELVCLVAYLVPRTAVIGAVLWTGYLGGAIATHVRVDSPLFSHTLFPIYVAALLWGGLYLRDARVRHLLGRAQRA